MKQMLCSQKYIKLALGGVPLLFLRYSKKGKWNLYKFSILMIQLAFKCAQWPMQTIFLLRACFTQALREWKLAFLFIVLKRQISLSELCRNVILTEWQSQHWKSWPASQLLAINRDQFWEQLKGTNRAGGLPLPGKGLLIFVERFSGLSVHTKL